MSSTPSLSPLVGQSLAAHYDRVRRRVHALVELRDFDRAVDMVLATLAAQREADWSAPYRGVGAEDVTDRLGMFLRGAAHADHHAGQMIYLCRQLGLDSTPGRA